jgi:glucose/arabinose dehydrogenase
MKSILALLAIAAALPAQDKSLTYRTENAFGDLVFNQPIGLAQAPGERDRLFVLEKGGRVIAVNQLGSRPSKEVFLDLTNPRDGKLETGSECGVLGVAFHPQFSRNREVYVFYSLKVGGKLHQRISRFRANDAGKSVDPSTEEPLISQPDPAGNHNAGDLHFGPDGYLYIACGDGGSADDRFDTGRKIDEGFHSAVYRIDVDRRAGNLRPNPHEAVCLDASGSPRYLVPANNPFIRTRQHRGEPVDASKLRTETWATGLRNVWRMTYDARSQRWFTGDVGQNELEEINILVAGGDYGWSVREAAKPFARAKGKAGNGRLIDPIFQYGRDIGASVTGGIVHRGSTLPELSGAYIFADFASGRILAIRERAGRWSAGEVIARDGNVAGFGAHPINGDLLFCNMGNGTVRRLVK